MKKRIRYNGKIYEVSEEKVANFLFKYNGAELLDSEPLKKKEQSTNVSSNGTSSTSQSKSASKSTYIDVNEFNREMAGLSDTNKEIFSYNKQNQDRLLGKQDNTIYQPIQAPIKLQYKEKYKASVLNRVLNSSTNGTATADDFNELYKVAPLAVRQIAKIITPTFDENSIGNGETTKEMENALKARKKLIDLDNGNGVFDKQAFDDYDRLNPNESLRLKTSIKNKYGIVGDSNEDLAKNGTVKVAQIVDENKFNQAQKDIQDFGLTINLQKNLTTKNSQNDFDWNNEQDKKSILELTTRRKQELKDAYISENLSQARKNSNNFYNGYGGGGTSEGYRIAELSNTYAEAFEKEHPTINNTINIFTNKVKQDNIKRILGDANDYNNDTKIKVGLQNLKVTDKAQYDRVVLDLKFKGFDENGNYVGKDEINYDYSLGGEVIGTIERVKATTIPNLRSVLGDYASYELERDALNGISEFAAANGNSLLKDKTSTDLRNLNKDHKEYAIQKGLDIIAAYNHKVDNRNNNGWWRDRPSVGTAKKWMDNQELKDMFYGQEDVYEITKEALKNPERNKLVTNNGDLDIKIGGLFNNLLGSFSHGMQSMANFINPNYGDEERAFSNINEPLQTKGTLGNATRGMETISPEMQREAFQLKEKIKLGEATEEEQKNTIL